MNAVFFVYNQSPKPVSVTVEYTDPAPGGRVTRTAVIAPGSRAPLVPPGSGPAPAVRCAAESGDGSLHWAGRTFELADYDGLAEYTHVLVARCDGPGCPAPWPQPTTRQRPAEEDQAG